MHDDTANVLATMDPDHWTVTIRDGEPVLEITVQGAADFVLAQDERSIGVAGVLDLLHDTLPADLWRDLLDELARREVTSDA